MSYKPYALAVVASFLLSGAAHAQGADPNGALMLFGADPLVTTDRTTRTTIRFRRVGPRPLRRVTIRRTTRIERNVIPVAVAKEQALFNQQAVGAAPVEAIFRANDPGEDDLLSNGTSGVFDKTTSTSSGRNPAKIVEKTGMPTLSNSAVNAMNQFTMDNMSMSDVYRKPVRIRGRLGRLQNHDPIVNQQAVANARTSARMIMNNINTRNTNISNSAIGAANNITLQTNPAMPNVGN